MTAVISAYIKKIYRPGWSCSVDWALACEPKHRWFSSQSGHMPGLWARWGPQWGMRKSQPHIDVSLHLFLPSLIINKLFLKKFIKLGEFLCSHFVTLKMKENKWHFWHTMLDYFKKGKNSTETHTHKRFVQYMEEVLWLIDCVKHGLWSFMLEISCWTMLHGQQQSN